MTRALPMLLLLAGCASADLRALDQAKTLAAAGDLAAIAALPPPCTDLSETCRQAQEIRAQSCMALSHPDLSHPDLSHPDCATTAYAAALAAAAPTLPRADRQRLLRNLATAAQHHRDAGSPAAVITQREAAQSLLALDPSDPQGCFHLASARLFDALAIPPGPARCVHLTPPPATCPASAPRQQLALQRRSLACP